MVTPRGLRELIAPQMAELKEDFLRRLLLMALMSLLPDSDKVSLSISMLPSAAALRSLSSCSAGGLSARGALS